MKRKYRSKVTRKGQITIAAQARRDVGLEIGDAVDVVVEDGRIVGVEPAADWTKRTFGILKDRGSEEYGTDESDAWADSAAERDEGTKRGKRSGK